ncbi:MAG: hypothetical protein ACI8U3_002465 [Brevundimonas sp.]|jgi:uncharacterized protein (UPF0276 family)|uniref:MNIO family bufferin maturase n=1 Tax=Brevundimonas sp. TaxID=1871086 RepID=UPI0039E31E67
MHPTAGLGLKPQHYSEALACPAPGLWFEVHPENYMVQGGPRLGWLAAIRERHPLSLHGVGMSLAGAEPPDAVHLKALRALIDRFEPFVVSEHLAWSRHAGAYHPDLLPFPRTRALLDRICDHVDAAQDVLGRRLLIENPSLYLTLTGHEMDEVEFLAALARRTGCGLLLDVNNVHVSAHNLGFDPVAYLDAVPAGLIGEVHLAGCAPDPQWGEALLIDSHAAPVSEDVWALYARLIARVGAKPTLIERDADLPPFDHLLAERDRAHGLLSAARERSVIHV